MVENNYEVPGLVVPGAISNNVFCCRPLLAMDNPFPTSCTTCIFNSIELNRVKYIFSCAATLHVIMCCATPVNYIEQRMFGQNDSKLD